MVPVSTVTRNGALCRLTNAARSSLRPLLRYSACTQRRPRASLSEISTGAIFGSAGADAGAETTAGLTLAPSSAVEVAAAWRDMRISASGRPVTAIAQANGTFQVLIEGRMMLPFQSRMLAHPQCKTAFS